MARRQTLAQKMCVKCRKTKPITEFYKNETWKEQSYCDAYCKECAQKMCKDKLGVREYFSRTTDCGLRKYGRLQRREHNTSLQPTKNT